MEFDLGSAIVVGVIVIICVLPFIFMTRGRKKRNRKKLHLLTKAADEKNCQITQHEFCGNIAIGIDNTNHALFFTNQADNKVDEQYVDLYAVNDCKVEKVVKTFRNKGVNKQEIDRLNLCFSPNLKNQPEIKLEFFNAEESIQLSGELQAIEKWSKQIGERLKNLN